MGNVFENDSFHSHSNFRLGVLVGVLDFKTATKLVFYAFWNIPKRLENGKIVFRNLNLFFKRTEGENEYFIRFHIKTKKKVSTNFVCNLFNQNKASITKIILLRD